MHNFLNIEPFSSDFEGIDGQSSRDVPQYPLERLYLKHLESGLALSEQQVLQAYRLRYQAYCVDNHFENPAEFPSGLETDRLDGRSVQALLRHCQTGLCVGAARLILPSVDFLKDPLPMVAAADLTACAGAAPFPLATTGEISRFSVTREGRGLVCAGVMIEQDRRQLLLHFPLGLVRRLLEIAISQNLTHLCAVMEPPLLRLLTRFGIHFHNYGPLVEHHGLRQPCWIEISTMLEQISIERPDVRSLLGFHLETEELSGLGGRIREFLRSRSVRQ